MASSSTTPNHYYRPELDLVRFLAFFLVFLSHALPDGSNPRIIILLKGFAPLFTDLTNAFRLGLSLFFTLSAFLICELLLREKQLTGDIQVKQFYLRRILRIWPLYYFALALGVAVAFLSGGQPDLVLKIGWYAVFLATWSTAHFGWIANPVFPLWSVSIEEQFYLVAPWLLKFLSRRLLYGSCFVLVAVANLWLFHFGRVRESGDVIWVNSFVQFECFAAGILLCLLLHGRLPRLSIRQRLLLLAGSCFCWLLSWHEQYSQFAINENPGSWPLIASYALAALGSVIVLIAFLGIDLKLIPRWAVYLGRISFGLYVYHMFAVDAVFALIPRTGSHIVFVFILKVLLAFGLTVMMAALSYRYIESPFLKMKKRHAVIQSAPSRAIPLLSAPRSAYF